MPTIIDLMRTYVTELESSKYKTDFKQFKTMMADLTTEQKVDILTSLSFALMLKLADEEPETIIPDDTEIATFGDQVDCIVIKGPGL